MVRTSTLATMALAAFWAAPALPQARVTDVTPADAALSAARLGSTELEAIDADADDLSPGDLLSCNEEDAVVVLECPPGSSNNVNLTAPFRVAIGVPSAHDGGGCHVDLQAGAADVLDEEDTEVTVGGVEMKAVGTQFAVRVSRGAQGAERRVIVYDGEVEVREQGELVRVQKGRMLAFERSLAGTEPVVAPAAEVDRSARVYSRVDLAKAEKLGTVENREALQATLQRQHYEVLSRPDDETKRVELAKTQMEYRVNDRAVYNLKRAGVVDPAGFARYQIDSQVLEQGLSPTNRLYLQERDVVAPRGSGDRFEVGPSELPAVGRRTTEGDLELIDAGQASRALEGIEHRLEEGTGGSRDWYAQARAYASLGDANRAAASGRRALLQARRDGRLTDAEARWLEALIERLGDP